jgi:hypothetical protein
MKNKPVSFLWLGLLAALFVPIVASPADAQPPPPSSENGFNALIQSLQTARDTVLFNEPDDGIDQAEGLRHVLRLEEFAYDDYERDPLHPTVERCPGLICKLGFDSPDQVQVQIEPLSPQYTYRVFGNLESADYVNFQIIDPSFTGQIFTTDADLVVGEDGSYEIFLGAFNATGAPNFLEVPPPVINNGIPQFPSLLIRIIHADWTTEIEPSVQVEVLGPTGAPIDSGLTPIPNLNPITFFIDTLVAGSTVNAILDSFSTIPFNFTMQDLTDGGSFPPVGTPLLGSAGLPINKTTNAKYDLPTDMAIIVERAPADIRSGNIQLGNRWLESLDYGSRMVSHNLFQSYQDADDIYRYVIAHEDQGWPNWLDTSGHEQGTIFMRWNLNSDDLNAATPTPTAIVVPVDEVWNYLPADHPIVTPEERNAEIEARRTAFNRRLNPAGFATFKDSDGDGEHNSTDQCPNTPDGEEVDGNGCDQEQFCSAIDVSGQGWKDCNNADFKNDEPLFAGDCEADRQNGVCLVR